MHGYQSYVWNKVVSERLRRFGRQVLVGDLAVKKDQAHLIDNVIDDEVPAAVDDEDGD